jgi:hypothetical protein
MTKPLSDDDIQPQTDAPIPLRSRTPPSLPQVPRLHIRLREDESVIGRRIVEVLDGHTTIGFLPAIKASYEMDANGMPGRLKVEFLANGDMDVSTNIARPQ